MGDNIYESYWQSKINEVLDCFRLGKNEFSIDVRELSKFGNRQSYYANFKIINGELEIARNHYAQGRDFHQVLSGTDYFKENLLDKTLLVKITNDLKLEITMAEQSSPQFFTTDDFANLEKFAGQKFDRDAPEKIDTYKHLKQAYDKINYWAEEVKRKVLDHGVVRIRKRPTNQANNFEEYLWAKLYPSQGLYNLGYLAFTLSISNSDGFTVKIDTVGWGENDPTRKKYLAIRGDFNNSRIVKNYRKEEVLSKNWEYLINESCKLIDSWKTEYYNIFNALGVKKTDESNYAHRHYLNTILYGPPGTGKTFNSINYAVAIIEGKNVDDVAQEVRGLVKERFDSYLNVGQIVFTTFHQSLSYEDFIEGLKPLPPPEGEEKTDTVNYDVLPGIFMKICDKARSSTKSSKEFDELWKGFFESLQKEKEVIFTSTESEMRLEKESTEQYLKIRFLRSWDSTKSEGTRIFTIGKDVIRKIFEAKVDVSPGASKQWVNVRSIVGAGRATLCLGIYKKFWEFAKVHDGISEEESPKPCVLIIDEINRGNVSQIFGELITLIEEDKREGKNEEIEVTLPYSKDKFKVPSNLYILGTMNTADRSIESLDTALRRRFSFIEMPPLYDLEELDKELLNVNLSGLLEVLNKRLEKLLNKDHLIGHSYFMWINSIDDLKSAFQNKILPLLQEYFYGDFGKIGLVLGEGFFEPLESAGIETNLFAPFGEYEVSELLERPIYRLKNVATISDEEFSSALRLLLNK